MIGAVYTKKQTYRITSKIYSFLRENPDSIVIGKLKRNTEGEYDPSTEIISLDPRYSLVPTLVHELLHHWHEDWSETRVLMEEAKIVRSLSARQMKNIIIMLGHSL